MKIEIPELSLVLLVGASGSGKSTFARTHFLPTEVISSDFCRGLVCDDPNAQAATKDAFEVLNYIAAKRLSAGRFTVIDATNVQPEARKPLIELARRFHVLPVAVVLNTAEKICRGRNEGRSDRDFGGHVIAGQIKNLRRSLRGLRREGFRHVFILDELESVGFVTIHRTPLWNDRRGEQGPFDVIGDVHGCFDELKDLFAQLGYAVADDFTVTPPDRRKALFLGDLVDRGPKSPDVLRLVMKMVQEGKALCVPGNHDVKLMRKLRGRDVNVAHGLAETLVQLESEAPEFREQAAEFIDGLVSHYVFDGGKLVVAHAGMREEMQGRGSGKVRDFALYGETTSEIDEFGLPVRENWAAEYRGQAMVVYGHTPVPEPEWLNRTVDIDTGCGFGGRLTALRYPEREFVSVPARQCYWVPTKPLKASEPPAATGLSSQQQLDDLLDLADVIGKRIVDTRLRPNITIRAENAAAALEVMSRFAVNPKWLIYLPPTMSPSETSQRDGYLEYPEEAFAYYRKQGVGEVVCEQKHMGSRAVVVICRDEHVARQRFGVAREGIGSCYTRTGRPFFGDAALQGQFLARIHTALGAAGFWERHRTDWVCLDCELMPWSAKAQQLLRSQYAATGAAAHAALSEAVDVLSQAAARHDDAVSLLQRYQQRAEMADQFVESYRRYCWPVNSLEDYKLAPFHLLATEGAVHADKRHEWHMREL